MSKKIGGRELGSNFWFIFCDDDDVDDDHDDDNNDEDNGNNDNNDDDDDVNVDYREATSSKLIENILRQFKPRKLKV